MLVNAVQRYMVLGLIFIGIFFTALIVLERIEGYHITTTEYYGLRNLGGLIYILSLILGFGLFSHFLCCYSYPDLMAAAEICMLSYDENFHLYDWVWMGRAVGF